MVAVLAGCGTPELTDVNFCSSGSHLAFACHHRRGPSSSPSGYSLGPFLFSHHYSTSQVLMLLNLNGKFLIPRIYRPQLNSIPINLPVPLNQVSSCLRTMGYIIDFLRLSTTQIFQNPCMIVVTIAATGMYRSLVNFDSSRM